MVNEQLYFYQTVVRKQTVVHLTPLFKNFFNPFYVVIQANFQNYFLYLGHKSKEDMSSAGEQLTSNRIYDDEYFKPLYRGFLFKNIHCQEWLIKLNTFLNYDPISI